MAPHRTPEPAVARVRSVATAGDVEADASSVSGPAVTSPAAEPDIRITINRVEVRAVTREPARPSRAEPERRKPAMSLDDYLDRRSGGQR